MLYVKYNIIHTSIKRQIQKSFTILHVTEKCNKQKSWKWFNKLIILIEIGRKFGDTCKKTERYIPTKLVGSIINQKNSFHKGYTPYSSCL